MTTVLVLAVVGALICTHAIAYCIGAIMEMRAFQKKLGEWGERMKP